MAGEQSSRHPLLTITGEVQAPVPALVQSGIFISSGSTSMICYDALKSPMITRSIHPSEFYAGEDEIRSDSDTAPDWKRSRWTRNETRQEERCRFCFRGWWWPQVIVTTSFDGSTGEKNKNVLSGNNNIPDKTRKAESEMHYPVFATFPIALLTIS